MEIINHVPPIKIGFDIPNLKRITNTAIHVMGMSSIVHLMPMRSGFTDKAFAVKQGCEYIIYLTEKILSKDELNDENIRIIIHELAHIQQMKLGYLKFSHNFTSVFWKGKEYTKDIPDDLKPYEREARRVERDNFDKVKSLLK